MENKENLLHLVIGVTGHRDCAPQAVAAVSKHVQEQLSQIKSRFHHLPVEVVTGLAEGADTIVAEIALELGIKVRAVLPMPLENYKDDFSEEGLLTLQKLVANPDVTTVEIPLSNSEEIDRDSQYVLLKDYIIRRSNILLALWDDQITGLPGGTSDVVVEYLAGPTMQSKIENNVTWANRPATDDDDGNLVIAVHTPRKGLPGAERKIEVKYLVSAGASNAIASLTGFPDKILQRWHGLDIYARDRYSNAAEQYTSYNLFQDGDDAHASELPRLDTEFIRADQLAMANQKHSDLLFKGFGIMAGMMGFLFLAYAKLAALKLFLIAYLILFAGGYFLFKVASKRRWFSKHLAYRALAEAFRVRYYLVLSGCSGSVHNNWLLKLTNVNRFAGYEWLGDAMRCAEPLVSSHNSEQGIELIRSRWIDDQSAYFKKKLAILHRHHSRLETLKTWLFAGAFFGTLALLFFKKDLLHTDFLEIDGKTWLVFFMGLLPLWLALWELYQSKMAIRELSWQYSNQRRIFSEASSQMETLSDTSSRREIIRRLAESSLLEIFQWTIHRFHREHEPPTAG